MEYEEIEAVFAGKPLADLLAMRDYLNDELIEPVVERIGRLWKNAVCEKGQRLDGLAVTRTTGGLHAECRLEWAYDGDTIRDLEIAIPYDTASDETQCAAFFENYKQRVREAIERAKRLAAAQDREKKLADLQRLQKELGVE